MKPGLHAFIAQVDVRDGLDCDNVFFGSFKKSPPFEVVCVSQSHTLDYHDPLFYLHLAMNPNQNDSGLVDSPFKMDFVSASVLQGRLTHDLARGVDLIIFPGRKDEIPDMGNYLLRYVESGGGILFFTGPEVWASKQNKDFGAVLPAQFGKNVTADYIQSRPVHISYYDKEHSIFNLFLNNDSGDLSKPTFNAWNELIPKQEASVLARFENDVPMLVHQSIGKGNVVLLNVSVGDEWSDWLKRRTYLPVLQEIGLFLCNHTSDTAPWFHQVGESVTFLSPITEPLSHQSYTPEEGEVIQKITDEHGRATWLFGEPGLHKVDLGGGEMDQAALNTDPRESNWIFSEPDEVDALIVRAQTPLREAKGDAPWDFDQKELWRWLMCVGGFLLIAEMLVSNRLTT